MRLAAALLFTSLSLTAQNAPEIANPRTSPADIEAGGKTFRSHCSPCHGLRGEGGLGPNLAAGRFFHGTTDADLLNNISNGIPGTRMPGLFYSPDRVWQVVAYIRSLNTPGSPRSFGDPRHGAELFRSQRCAQCHRVNGVGGRLGPDLSDIGQSRSPDFLRTSLLDPGADVAPRYWTVRCRDAAGNLIEGFLMDEDTYTVRIIDMQQRLRSLHKSELKDYRVDKSSRMPSYKGVLTEQDLGDVVSFLTSLQPAGENR
jgi:putative heme-binding domain-containing protein